MAAEIVIVLEDQDFRLLAGLLAVEERRGEARYAAADHDEVVASRRSVSGAGALSQKVPSRTECITFIAASLWPRSPVSAGGLASVAAAKAR